MLTGILSVTIIGLCYCLEKAPEPVENRLHHDLLHVRSYSKLIRPVDSNLQRLTVKVGLRLSQLLDMDEKNQIMTTSVWLRQEWFDQRLKWNPSEYGGIKMTHIPSDHLWRPDMLLYNNADGDFVVTLLTKATVHFDGKIIWEPPVIYKSYCPIDVEYFPFDMQECFMKFGSWTYDGHELDLQHICDAQAVYNEETKEKVITWGIDIKDFYPNVEWDIINVTARRKEKFYPCCPEPYPDITFNITLRRRTLFYSLNLIMPCVSISCLTVLVFYLPSDSGEKITLSISILLALTVFFLLLSDINPPTSFVIPLIGKYLLFTMIVVTMSIFLAVYTLGINFRRPATHRMSPWVRRVFTEILPRILLMRRPDMERTTRVPIRTCNGIEMRDVRDIYSSSQASSHSKEWTTETTYENTQSNSDLTKYPREIREAFQGVISIADHLKTEDEENSEARDWKYIAMVMDRLFLYIFTTACVCGTLSIFLYAPSLYDSRPPLSSDKRYGNCTY
ncbi:acetylcholine receptor subunit alpha-like 1 isoform X1 [Mytilus californianus]|uniref:acetylcholine receptor subunit alpha-like 1 isoform X1 n=1 Tax=Mytilus californianus TaxID=6549 RepID=UPI0022472304|nr:acetylcholine receptor subunit alpha-like 1 isoform X1 [Mytilus californianus]